MRSIYNNRKENGQMTDNTTAKKNIEKPTKNNRTTSQLQESLQRTTYYGISFIIPAKAREYVFTGVGCLCVCL